MTSETKRFIELSDIIGIRVKCRSCGCSLLIDATKDDGPIGNLMLAHNSVLGICPTCSHPWTATQPGRATWDSDIKEFVRKMQSLKRAVGTLGCALELEIKHENQQ